MRKEVSFDELKRKGDAAFRRGSYEEAYEVSGRDETAPHRTDE